ncbi:peptidase S8 and S53 subtilisin kexin sedolisin [Thermincola ferriacetica]|uniref:Peptidase S8 and S53 subtilisin kexin sedolisin n=1 Tax=Thermincola ferriacetica TaxID=281456 RepID=A0A0L6W0N2_9FIRM|nr:S8 family peptidase [Thermincola ferriacetica]KNZ69090.1 peptidase S8 and S53 subtilisin kexin sedolisin [Thermincola ferriacetica]
MADIFAQKVRENSFKLCRVLKNKINEMDSFPRWMPTFLRRPLQFFRDIFVKQKIIVQLNDRYVSVLTAGDKKILGCKVDARLNIINGFSTTVNMRKLKQLIIHESVAGVWVDRKVKAVLDVAAPVVGAPPVWQTGYEGKGVGIAILDTGIYPHPDLTRPVNRIIAFKDFINKKTQPYDDNGHGTHCAGDAAGNGYASNGKYRGPAPKANLIGVKVLDKKGSGLLSRVMAGVQWCMENKRQYGIKVLSLSVGVKATESYKNDPLCLALGKAWEAGLVVCAAAGNDGPDRQTINSPGISPVIITVGAEDDRNTVRISDDPVASFSSRGPTVDGLEKPDLVAPGVNIVSLRSPCSYLDLRSRRARVGKHYLSMSGTSMATPICAGVAALLLESSPHLQPDDVKKLLMDTCRKINYNPNAAGAGLIDAAAAIRRAGSPQLERL